MVSREDLLDFTNKFEKIPIITAIKDDNLKVKIKEFLNTWNNLFIKESLDWYCSYMVTHGLTHINNLFLFANRLYHDSKERIEEYLNCADIFCLIISIWLHDISLSKNFFNIESKKELHNLNQYLKVYDVAPLSSISQIDCLWVREHHALLTKYTILNKTNLPIIKELPSEIQQIIASICFYHTKKTILKDEPKQEDLKYYKAKPLSEIGFPKFKYLNEEYTVHVLLLASLLRFLDGCDQTEHRIIGNETIRRAEKKNLHDQQILFEKVTSELKKLEKSKSISQNLILVWEETWKHKIIKKYIKNFLKNYQEETGKKDDIIVKKTKELKLINEQIEEHFKYKNSVKDIYFYDGKIILYPSDPSIIQENSDIKKVINDIKKELKTCESILIAPPINLPYNRNNLFVRSDIPPDKLEAPLYKLEEPRLFITLERKLEENETTKRFPIEEDFKKKGKAYFDEKEIRRIVDEILESIRYCLLGGPPSMRKTTFSLSLGLYLKNKSGYSVFYYDVRKNEDRNKWRDILRNFSSYDDEKTLFIIDECHNSPNTVGYFLDEVLKTMHRAKFLFVSRYISKERFYPRDLDYITKLKNVKAWDDLNLVFKGVIKQFCISNNIKIYEKQIGNIEKIIITCGHKITVLNELLEVWKRINFEEVLSEIPKMKIYEKVRDEYLANEIRTKILTRLSAIYQFEIGISPDFLDFENIYSDDNLKTTFKELENEGLIYEKISKNTVQRYYTIHDDSSFARLILEASDHLKLIFSNGHLKSEQELTYEIIERYIGTNKEYVQGILNVIFDYGELELGEKLIQNREIILGLRDYLRQLKSLSSINRTLSHLRTFKIKESDKNIILSDDTLKIWAKNISSSKNLVKIMFLLKELEIQNREKAKKCLDMADPNELARNYKKIVFEEGRHKDVKTFARWISNFNKISKDFSLEFFSNFTEEELFDLMKSSNKNQLYNFLRGYGFIKKVKTAYKIFLDERDEQEWLFYLNDLDLHQIGRFFHISYFYLKIQNVYKLFFEQFLLEKMRKSSLKEITKYFTELSEIRYSKKPQIGYRLAIENIKIFWKSIFIDQKLKEASLNSIQNLISRGKELDMDIFVRDVEKKLEASSFDMLEKIKESSIKELGLFIYNISNSPSIITKCDKTLKISKPILIKKIGELLKTPNKIDGSTQNKKKSGLHGITIFLWSLNLIDSELQKIFSGDILVEGLGRKYEKIGEKLSFIGVFNIINAGSIKGIKSSKIQTMISDSERELRRWLNARISNWYEKQKLGYPRRGFIDLIKFIFAINGYMLIDEKKCVSFLNIYLKKDIEKLLENLNEIKLENKKCEIQVNEFRNLLSKEFGRKREGVGQRS